MEYELVFHLSTYSIHPLCISPSNLMEYLLMFVEKGRNKQLHNENNLFPPYWIPRFSEKSG